MTGAEADPAQRALRYRTAIDMAKYADKQGFYQCQRGRTPRRGKRLVTVPAHHGRGHRRRTDQCSIGVMALLVALYDPIRLAEDIAVVDLLSEGRLNFVAGMGYREVEFHIANKPFAERGRWMDHVLETLSRAWSDEPFEPQGKESQRHAQPFSRPHPLFLVGGMSKPAVRPRGTTPGPLRTAGGRPGTGGVLLRATAKVRQAGLYTLTSGGFFRPVHPRNPGSRPGGTGGTFLMKSSNTAAGKRRASIARWSSAATPCGDIARGKTLRDHHATGVPAASIVNGMISSPPSIP